MFFSFYFYISVVFYVKDWEKNQKFSKVWKIYQFSNLETIMKSRISTVCFVYHVAAHR